MRCSSAGAAPQATLNSLRTLLHPALARVHVASASLAHTAFAYDDEALAYASLDVRRDAAGHEVPNQLPATAGEPQRCATWLARGSVGSDDPRKLLVTNWLGVVVGNPKTFGNGLVRTCEA